MLLIHAKLLSVLNPLSAEFFKFFSNVWCTKSSLTQAFFGKKLFDMYFDFVFTFAHVLSP